MASSRSCYAAFCTGVYLIVADSNRSSLCIQPAAHRGRAAMYRCSDSPRTFWPFVT